jgi:hypothetical protein
MAVAATSAAALREATFAPVPSRAAAGAAGELSFMYRYISRESC